MYGLLAASEINILNCKLLHDPEIVLLNISQDKLSENEKRVVKNWLVAATDAGKVLEVVICAR